MDKFGKLIRSCRHAKGETIKDLSEVLECSESFAKHIEGSEIVPMSGRILSALKRHYRGASKRIDVFAKERNKVGRTYYKKYRKKRI